MLPYFREHFGNASSVHAFGQEAKGALETARAQVAALLNASPGEIVFTSGGTEADNLGVIGGALAMAARGKHVVVSQIEHDAVRQAADHLEKTGFTVDRVPPDSRGVVASAAIAAAIRPDTALVSVMAANNETGVIQPTAEIGGICAERGVAFHVDAVQVVSKTPIDVKAWQATLVTIAGHKFYAPKGVGALYVRSGFKPEPLQVGGSHERGRRAGTENIPGIVGLGKAAELARAELGAEPARLAALRDRLEAGIMRGVPNVVGHGAGAPRVPNTSHLSFVGAEGEHLVLSLDMKGIAASSGSACQSGSSSPSHVLLAMGVPRDVAQSAVRFSLGRWTTDSDVDRVIQVLPALVSALRAVSPAAAS
jgi:cysteine desulfurase